MEENPVRNDENLKQSQCTLYALYTESLAGSELSHIVYYSILTFFVSYFIIKMMNLMLDLSVFSRLDLTAVGEGGPKLVSLELTLTATVAFIRP